MVTSTNLRYVILCIGIIALITISPQGCNQSLPFTSYIPKGAYLNNFDQEFVYIYDENEGNQTFNFTLDNLILCEFNALDFNFVVEGDQTDSSGLTIVFDFNSSEVRFDISRAYQDGNVQNVSKAFEYPAYYNGEFNLTIFISGKASNGKSGQIRILAESAVRNLSIIALGIEEKNYDLATEEIMIDSKLSGVTYYTMKTISFCANNDSYSHNVSLSFETSEFVAFVSSVEITVNSNSYETLSFDSEESFNEHFELPLYQGKNVLELRFGIGISINTVYISDIELKGQLVEEIVEDDSFLKVISWIAGIDEFVDLSPLKPSSMKDTQILKIEIDYSCEGTVVFPGISYQLFQGMTLLEESEITPNKQLQEKVTLTFDLYTTNYLKDLRIRFYAVTLGEGTIFIYNSTAIAIKEVENFDGQFAERLLIEEDQISLLNQGNLIKKYYDVIYHTDSIKEFKSNFSLFLEKQSELEYDSFSVTLRMNGYTLYTELIKEDGLIVIERDIELINSFNEIEFIIQVIGSGYVCNLQDVKYTVSVLDEQVDDDNITDSFNVPLFKSPRTIFIGIVVLFDCWLVLGITMRIYKGHKHKKRKLTENDDFILEIMQIDSEND